MGRWPIFRADAGGALLSAAARGAGCGADCIAAWLRLPGIFGKAEAIFGTAEASFGAADAIFGTAEVSFWHGGGYFWHGGG
jgi:hypothetical protein